MKLTIQYSTLVDKLRYVLNVVEGSMNDESVKNVIFKVTENSCVLMGCTPRTICRTYLEKTDYSLVLTEKEVENKVLYFQVKAKELNNFLGTFKALKLTTADICTFSLVGLQVQLKVLELPKTEELSYLKQVSSCMFENLPIKDYVLKDANTDISGVEMHDIESKEVLLYIKNLLPLIKGNGNDGMATKIHFDSNYVFAVSSFATLMKNKLPEALRGIVLTVQTISFLDKLLSGNEKVQVGKTDTYLIVRVEGSDALVRYQVKMPDSNMYVSLYQKQHSIRLNRVYLMDVLKRFALINEPVTFEIKADEEKATLHNSKFKQDVPILYSQGMSDLGLVTFKLSPVILNKAVIGSNDNFEVYFVPFKKGGFTLVTADQTEEWFSMLQVR